MVLGGGIPVTGGCTRTTIETLQYPQFLNILIWALGPVNKAEKTTLKERNKAGIFHHF